jgi:hypothetical protein
MLEPAMLETAARIALIGIGATVLIDAWTLMLRRVFKTPSLDFRLVGRCVGHMRSGRFAHDRIAAASPVRGERLLGWGTHYATGVVFAAALALVVGANWMTAPTAWPALLFGLATVTAPFVVMQPALGLGFAASKSPAPWKARLRSVTTHLIFGAGLYVCTLLVNGAFDAWSAR